MTRQYIITMVLAIAVIGMGFFLYNTMTELKGLRKSHEIIEKSLNDEKEQIKEKDKATDSEIKDLQDELSGVRKSNKKLEKILSEINNDEEKDRIRAIRNADSLRSVVANRYYRR